MKPPPTCEGSRTPFWVVHEILQRRHTQERLVIMLLNAVKQRSPVPQTQEKACPNATGHIEAAGPGPKAYLPELVSPAAAGKAPRTAG